MQTRSISGREYEIKVAEKYGRLICKSPKIVWNAQGKYNLDKIVNSEFNGYKLSPTNESTYDKYDVILSSGEKVEVKKYSTDKIKSKFKLSKVNLKLNKFNLN